jgi:RNA polymerase sigma factor (TIGR02999 family)
MNDATLAAEAEALLDALGQGAAPSGALFDRLYADLRVIATHHRARWIGDDTLNTTALVHEAYLKLAHVQVEGRAHLLAVASRAMRQVLVSYAEARGAQKRGGGATHLAYDDALVAAPLTEAQADRAAVLEDALRRLEAVDPRAARVVECRFFGGLTVEETAEALGLSAASVVRAWRMARAWLYGELRTSLTGAWPALADEA